jgi:hypothetical protein
MNKWVLEEKSFSIPHCPQQVPQGPIWDLTWAVATTTSFLHLYPKSKYKTVRYKIIFFHLYFLKRRSLMSCGLRCGSEAASYLVSRVRIPLRAWMFVSCVRCGWCRYWPIRWADPSFRGALPSVCARLIGCDLETLTMRWPNPNSVVAAQKKIILHTVVLKDRMRFWP